MSTIALHLTLNISETVRDLDLVPKYHQSEMTYGVWSQIVTSPMTSCCEVLWGSPVGYPSDSLASCFSNRWPESQLWSNMDCICCSKRCLLNSSRYDAYL